MTAKPSAHERLLWIVLACLAWKYATTMESAGVSRDAMLPIVLWITMWAMGLAALVLGLSDRFNHWLRGWPIFGFFTSTFVAYGIVNVMARARDPYMFTTDAHTFMDYAARLLLDGKNPYDWSLSGAFAIHQMPSDLQTPLENGGLSDRLAYPAFSFLYAVPFVKLGVPSSLAYAVALYGCLAVIFWAAPPALRPLVLLPFFVDQSYLAYAFGGVTDSVWALLLCLAVVCWARRPAWAAFFVGLACAYKQHACLLAPFLLVRLARETEGAARRRAIGRFVAIVGGTFALLNLPFLLWSPKSFVLGMVEPLIAEMVPLGEGPTAFVALGGVSAPKLLFTAVFWGTYFGLLAVCAKWSRGRALVWIAPSLAFFLNYRSLSSYWYFNVLPFVVDLAVTPPPETAEPLGPRVRKIAIAYAAALAAAFGIVAAYSRERHAAVDVEIHEPMRTWMSHTHRLDLRLSNRGKSAIHLRFWMQGDNFQPLPWRIDLGPHTLEPGQSAEYSISAIMRSSAFDEMRGGTLIVDDPNSGFRKRVVIPPDAAWGSFRAIPNARFRFWDVRAGAPSYWGLLQSGSPGAFAEPLVADKGEGGRQGIVLGVDSDPRHGETERLQLCLEISTCWASPAAALFYTPGDLTSADHTVGAAVELASRSARFAVWAKPPVDANAPPYGERYGVRVAFGDKEVLVLLGGEPGEARLASGTPLFVVPGPKGVWSRFEIDLEAIEKKFAAEVYPSWGHLFRYPLLDIPIIPMRLTLEYTTRAPEPRRVAFGVIEDGIEGKESPDEAYRELMKHPAQIDMMRARYETELGNPTRGSRYLDHGRAVESHPELDLAGARLAAHHLHFDEAKALYLKVEPARPVAANLGLGWTLMAQGDPRGSLDRFQRAIAALDAAAAERRGRVLAVEELDRQNAQLGIAIAHAQLGNCAPIKELLPALTASDREVKIKDVPEFRKCAGAPAPALAPSGRP